MNCLELMDNHHILEELRFAPGDGTLNYYVYNYKCRPVDNSKIGLFML
jgi:glycylpeptide N-tetradecanoyltransferase